MAHAPERTVLALLDLLDVSFGRDAASLGLRPPVARGVLGAVAQRVPGQRLPAALTGLFRWHDGQEPGAPSLHPRVDWRLLAAEEMAEQTGADDAGFALFETRDGDVVRVMRDGSLVDVVDGPLTLNAFLTEVLEQRGVSLARPPRPARPFGEVLEELLALVRESSCVPLRGSDAAELDGLAAQGLPATLQTWFALHDGQPEDAPQEEYGQGLHPRFRARALSAAEVRAHWDGLRAERLVPPATPTCVPLFAGEGERLLAVETAGPHEGELLWLDRDEDAWRARPLALSLVEWLDEAATVRRNDARRPELDVPDDYATTPAQRRVLALGSILYQRDEQRHDLLGGALRVVGAAPAFAGHAAHWGRTTPEGLRRTLAGLLDPTSDPARDASDGERDDAALAWDLGCASALAGRAYVAGMLSREEAWAACLRAETLARLRFDSWESFGTAYAVSYRAWCEENARDDEDVLAEVEVAVARLLGPGGAWRETPWETSTGDVPPPSEPRMRTREVDPDTLLDALHTAEPGDRLRLAPGTYRAPLRVATSVELIAAGPGVVLSPEGHGAGLTVAGASLFLEGVDVRAPGPEHGAPSAGVVVESGYLCMRGGSIEAARNALEVTASEHALLMDVRVRAERGVACWVGPNAELGLSGVHIEESGTGVEALGSACMDGGCITDAETHAWVARGGEIVAHDVTARGTELTTAASVDGGTLRLRGCALLDNAGVGAVVGDGARAELVGVRFERSGGAHVQVFDAFRAVFLDCTFDTCGGSAVALWPGGGAHFEGCTVVRSAQAAVWARGAVDDYPEWVGGSIEGHDEAGAVFATDGAELVVESASLRAGAVVGVEATTGATVRLREVTVEATAGAAWVHHDAKLSWDHGSARSASGNAVLATDGGSFYADGLEVRSGGVGVALGQGVVSLLHRCRFIEPGAQAVLCDGAVVTALHCAMETPGEEALYVTAGGKAVVHDCTARGCGDLALRLDGAHAWVQGCTLSDGKSAAIGAFGETALWLVDTRIDGTGSAGVELADDAEAWFSGCTVEAPGENAIFAYDRARVQVVGGALAGGSENAVAVDDDAHVTLEAVALTPGAQGLLGGPRADSAKQVKAGTCPSWRDVADGDARFAVLAEAHAGFTEEGEEEG
ncbi:MAG: DUF1266 domain-containing protein [Polyangiales bacterium]